MRAPEGRPTAVVLAAGRGSRLGDLVRERPKCLVEVLGEPILGWTLRALEALGIDRLVMVVGYRESRIRDFLDRRTGSLAVTYAVNERYGETGTARSLQLGLGATPPGGAVLVIEGDVVFEPELLRRLAQTTERSTTVLARYRSDLHGTFARRSRRGRVTAWYHESAHPPDFEFATAYKTVNLHRFTGADVSTVLRPALTRALQRWGPAAPLERAMQLWVEDGAAPIEGINAGDARWYEVDTAEDLAAAERRMAAGAWGCAGSRAP